MQIQELRWARCSAVGDQRETGLAPFGAVSYFEAPASGFLASHYHHRLFGRLGGA